MKVKLIPFLLLFFLSLVSKGQDNKAIQQYLKLLYNMQFEEAHDLLSQFDNNSSSLTTKFLKTYYIRWKDLPLTEASSSFKQFVNLLDEVIDHTTKQLKKNPADSMALYFEMASHLMKAEVYANSGHMSKALFQGKSALYLIKKGFKLHHSTPEFLLSSGLYNYYVEYYRNQSFFYSSVLWPFPNGNQQLGLKLLKEGNQKATFSAVECLIYLSHISFKLENEPFKALHYTRALSIQYPNNLKFLELLIENLIACNYLEEAEKLNVKLLESEGHYYSARAKVFSALILMRKYKDYGKALLLIEDASPQLVQNQHFESLMHLIKGNIYLNTNNKMASNELKKAKKKAKYKYVENLADNLMNP